MYAHLSLTDLAHSTQLTSPFEIYAKTIIFTGYFLSSILFLDLCSLLFLKVGMCIFGVGVCGQADVVEKLVGYHLIHINI